MHGDCAPGQACVDAVCNDIECYTSDECDRGAFCSNDHQCTGGCEIPSDCSAGETCEAGACTPFNCRESALDCAYGEVCQDGACIDHGGGACEVCDPGIDDYCFPLYEGNACGPDATCPAGERCYVADYDRTEVCTSDAQCTEGYACKDITFSDGSTAGPHCTRTACFAGAVYPPCSPSEANTCGRGFQCYDLGTDLGVCFADCEWLVAQGHL